MAKKEESIDPLKAVMEIKHFKEKAIIYSLKGVQSGVGGSKYFTIFSVQVTSARQAIP